MGTRAAASGIPDSDMWHIDHNQVIGNWVGFKPDGSYDPAFRVGQNNPGSADNGNGINAYDGSNFNLIEGNIISCVWDGIQTMSHNSTGNVIRNNLIGESPLGQPAPLTRWGIVVRLDSESHIIEGNTIRNTPSGGIGLTQQDVRFIRISRNIVTDTVGPAIYLAPDLANPPFGANNLQAAPVITSASTATVSGTGLNGATVEVYKASRPAGESGLPIEYLGSAVVSSGAWSVSVNLSDGDRVTALQIAPNNNTSALSTNVLVANAPPSSFIVNDGFGRTINGGWGSAELGGPYTVQGTAANFNVQGSEGRMALPNSNATRSALLNAVNAADVDVRVQIKTDKVITGGNAFVFAAVRRNGTNEYRPRLRFNANGSVSVNASVLLNNMESSLGTAVDVPGLNQTPNSFIWLRAQVSGTSPTTIRVKAWPDGQLEPAGWQFTATNSAAAVQAAGSAGLRAYTSAGVNNAPILFSFDEYSIAAPPPPPPPSSLAEDAFDRSVTNGWGTADVGGVYTLQGNLAAFSVAGGAGKIQLPAPGANRSALLDDVDEQNVDITFRVAIDKVATGNSYFVYAAARRNGNNAYRPKIVLNSNGTVSAHAGVLINGAETSVAPAVVVPGLSQAPGSYIWVRAQVTGTNPTTVRVKAWADGQAEPANWHFSATNAAAAVQVAGGVGLRVYLGTTVTNAPVLFSFDDFEVAGIP